MEAMSSSELMSIVVVMLANGRTCCVRPGMSTLPSHSRQVVKWMTGDGCVAGSRCGGRRTWLAAVGVIGGTKRQRWRWHWWRRCWRQRRVEGKTGGGVEGYLFLSLSPGPVANKGNTHLDARTIRNITFRDKMWDQNECTRTVLDTSIFLMSPHWTNPSIRHIRTRLVRLGQPLEMP
jgi:hypothetical protein